MSPSEGLNVSLFGSGIPATVAEDFGRRLRALEVERERERLELLKQPVKVELTKKRQKEEETREKAWRLFENILQETRDRYWAYWNNNRRYRYWSQSENHNDDHSWPVYEGRGKWLSYDRAYWARAYKLVVPMTEEERNKMENRKFPHLELDYRDYLPNEHVYPRYLRYYNHLPKVRLPLHLQPQLTEQSQRDLALHFQSMLTFPHVYQLLPRQEVDGRAIYAFRTADRVSPSVAPPTFEPGQHLELLDFPLEIRLMIYEFYFDKERTQEPPAPRGRDPPGRGNRNSPWRPLLRRLRTQAPHLEYVFRSHIDDPYQRKKFDIAVHQYCQEYMRARDTRLLDWGRVKPNVNLGDSAPRLYPYKKKDHRSETIEINQHGHLRVSLAPLCLVNKSLCRNVV